MLSASNFWRSSSRRPNICLQSDLCFDSVGFTSFSVLTSWKNMHLSNLSELESLPRNLLIHLWKGKQSPAFPSEISVTCYDLKLLSLVKQKQKLSDKARLNSTCYNTIRFLCNILTGIRSGNWKLTGIRTDVRELEGILDTYRFTCLIMSASVCMQRILYRYVSYRLWFQCKHFLTTNHLQVVSANTTFCAMIDSSIVICIFSS